MKTKTKILTIILSMCLVIAIMTVGVLAFTNATFTGGGSITWTGSTSDDTAPDVIIASDSLDESLTKDEINDEFVLKELKLDETSKEGSYVFTITNNEAATLNLKITFDIVDGDGTSLVTDGAFEYTITIDGDNYDSEIGIDIDTEEEITVTIAIKYNGTTDIVAGDVLSEITFTFE